MKARENIIHNFKKVLISWSKMMNKTKPKVLIVDDEQMNLQLMEALISPMDIETYTALNGRQALEMVKEVSPDVILLDIIMPDINGIEVCRRLKKDQTTQNIPVVFVTGLDSVEKHVEAIEAGGIGFITKPVEAILVQASVKNAIIMKQLYDEVDKQNKELLELNKKLDLLLSERTSQLFEALKENKELDRELELTIKDLVKNI